MLKPEETMNEPERLKALHHLHVLDTANEERFDRITRIAHKLFDTPISLISLVDDKRVWFKSKYGTESQESPRDTSFCAHAILQNEVMIVEDALKDQRFKDNPQVVGEPQIHFYLGYPLKFKRQFNIGTLCLMDQKAHKFNNTDLEIIKELGEMVEAEFDEIQLSTIDELTGISNRRGFISIGKQIIRRCNQYEKDVLLLIFDLNKLKAINNNYGHDEGDKALKLFAEQLLKNFRHTDAIARLGGDEFCVLCGGANKGHFDTITQRFERKLNSIHSDYPIEFSVCGVEYDRLRHFSIETLMEEADIKMYEQKRMRHSA